MSENQILPDEDDFNDPYDIINYEDDGDVNPILENDGNIQLGLENGQQLLTAEQLQAFGFEVPQTNLQSEQQALAPQPELIPDPLQFSGGQANSGFPLDHVDAVNGEGQYPTSSNVGQASSIFQNSSLPSAQQAAGNVLEWGPSHLSLGQAASEFQHSRLPNNQPVANEVPQDLPNLSLEQANLILRDIASRIGQQAAPSGAAQQSVEPLPSGFQASDSQSFQQAEGHRILQQSQNLRMVPTSVNLTQTPDLENPNPLNGSIELPNQNGIPTYNLGAGSSNDLRFLTDVLDPSRFPLSEERHADADALEGYLERNHNQDEADNGSNAASHQSGLHNEQDFNSEQAQPNLYNRDRANIPASPSEVNAPINAAPQLGNLAHQQTVDALQMLNQYNEPLNPRSSSGNDQHQPSDPANQQILGNAASQQALFIPQLPNMLNNQTDLENSPGDAIDQQILNSAGIQQNVGEPMSGRVDTQGNNIEAAASGQGTLSKVVHDQQYSETLEWMSSLLVDLTSHVTGINELNNEESKFQTIPPFQNHLQRPSSQRVQQGSSSVGPANPTGRVPIPGFRKLLGSCYSTSFGRQPEPALKFPAQLTRMRRNNSGHEAISRAIAIPELPSLDEEMVLNSKYTGFDTVSWCAEESNSPTISEINRAAKPGTVIPVETLFTHLFRLSRRSFLHREERVHLELITLFLKKSRLEGRIRCERDVKELIRWLERKFNRGHLAWLVLKLVVAIDETLPVRLLVDRTKTEYNSRNAEMTRLANFYTSVSTLHDIMEKNKDTTKRKQEVEKRIRQARNNIKKKGLRPPKGTYEKKRTETNDASDEKDDALIKSFDATKWLLVDCTESHYAYAQSVLKAAKALRDEAQVGRGAKLESLNEQLANLEGTGHTVQQEYIDIARVVITEEIESEVGRDMEVFEGTVLKCFLETISALCKVTVSGFLQTIGNLPHTLALTLEDGGEELEKVRGIGSGEESGVNDIVTVSRGVEVEKEKHAKHSRILEKRLSYLEECQEQLRIATGGEANQ